MRNTWKGKSAPSFHDLWKSFFQIWGWRWKTENTSTSVRVSLVLIFLKIILIIFRLENDKKELKLGDLEKELAELKAQEARFLEELESINKEEQELKKAIAEQKEFADQLEKNEKKYYKEHAKHSRDLMRIEDDARRFDI